MTARKRRVRALTAPTRAKLDRIVELLDEHGPLSMPQMLELLPMSKASLEALVWHLCTQHRYDHALRKRIYVQRRERRPSGIPLPYYAVRDDGQHDAPPLKPIPRAEIERAYRARKARAKVNPDPFLSAWMRPLETP